MTADPGRLIRHDQHCPRCGNILEDDNWCESCQETIPDAEITEHEHMWGGIWDD